MVWGKDMELIHWEFRGPTPSRDKHVNQASSLYPVKIPDSTIRLDRHKDSIYRLDTIHSKARWDRYIISSQDRDNKVKFSSLRQATGSKAKYMASTSRPDWVSSKDRFRDSSGKHMMVIGLFKSVTRSGGLQKTVL